MNILLTLAWHTWLEAAHNRLPRFVGIFLLLALSLTAFIGQLVMAEAALFQSALLGALLRFGSVMTLSLLVITGMVRALNEGGMWLVLSLSIPRASYFLGKLAGFSALAMALAMVCGLALLIYVPGDQVMLWGVALACELMIVAAFSLVCALALEQVMPAFGAVMGFYILSRTMDALRLMAADAVERSGALDLADRMMAGVIEAIAFILPELYRFTASDWLVYHVGTGTALLPILGQTVVYLILLTGVGLLDLYRKNLS
uniref:ABC-2 family transporter protein n=1 Tax=Candidatus Kentrum eta TaxID=2126337 RepID=A0A450UNZ2_9GAMM|nr:MAG: hypothetical protein BECKH772B_GA0070898_1005812 [Candidatus Kentron sp. H]